MLNLSFLYRFSSDAMSWNPGAKDVIVKMEAAIVSKDDVQHVCYCTLLCRVALIILTIFDQY